uniref:Prohibitin-3, mitochondrial n=1 Tax=Noccaea caerulescens TaxID=107243 RepID=A0A1J3CLY4_NOCCA
MQGIRMGMLLSNSTCMLLYNSTLCLQGQISRLDFMRFIKQKGNLVNDNKGKEEICSNKGYLLQVIIIIQSHSVLGLLVMSRPDVSRLPKTFNHLGLEYAEKVLPAIGNEVLKAVVAL